MDLGLPLDKVALESLRANRFDSVSIGKCSRDQARLLRRHLKASSLMVYQLGAAALNELIHVDGLSELHVQFLKGPCVLRGRISLQGLHVYFCGERKTSAADLAALRRWPDLQRLTWRSYLLGVQAVKHIAAMKNLLELDIEDSDFDDAQAVILAKGTCRLRKLHLANSKLTKRGLISLIQGQNGIEDLDLWGTPIHSCDLILLTSLPKLRRLSCGTYWRERHSGRNIIAAIEKMPQLEEIFLDRIDLSPEEVARIRQMVPKGQWCSEDSETVYWPVENTCY